MRALLFLVLFAFAVGCQTHSSHLVLPSMSAGTVDEQAALAIARRYATRDVTWASRAAYTAERRGTGWSVRVQKPDVDRGGYILILIDERGGVTRIVRGV
jgi:hypothetical protein